MKNLWWHVFAAVPGHGLKKLGVLKTTRAALQKELGKARVHYKEFEDHLTGEAIIYSRPSKSRRVSSRKNPGGRKLSRKAVTRYKRFYGLAQMRRYAKEHPEMRVWLVGTITANEIYAGVRPRALASRKATEKCDFCKRSFRKGSLARDVVDAALLVCSMCKGKLARRTRRVSSRKNPGGKYYSDGYHNGAEAAKVNIQEDPSLLAKYVEQDRLGEFVGELREHQVQFAGDISYDVGRGVTERQYESWESGFTDGFFSTVKKWLKGYRPTERQRTLLNRRR